MRSWNCVLAAAAAAVAIFTAPALARADALPPDGCTNPGQHCSNAGPMADEPGLCTAEMCPHALPDGGTAMVPCDICEPTEAGSSSGSSSGGGSSSGSGSSSSGGGGGGGGGGKGGCSFAPLARDGAAGLGMLALGLGAATLARRRRKP